MKRQKKYQNDFRQNLPTGGVGLVSRYDSQMAKILEFPFSTTEERYLKLPVASIFAAQEAEKSVSTPCARAWLRVSIIAGDPTNFAFHLTVIACLFELEPPGPDTVRVAVYVPGSV